MLLWGEPASRARPVSVQRLCGEMEKFLSLVFTQVKGDGMITWALTAALLLRVVCPFSVLVSVPDDDGHSLGRIDI